MTHLAELRKDAPSVVRRLFPHCDALYERLGWKLLPSIERVYVNERARRDLGWSPRYDFGYALERLERGRGPTQPADAGRRGEGLPRRLDVALHESLTRPRGAASDR